VTGLTQNDFQIFDQGKPQKIELFQVNAAAAASAANVPQPAPQPGVFTNREAPATGTADVILLDGIMTNTVDQMRARQQLLKFLAKVQPQDRVAIYLLSGGVQLVQAFTGDSAALVHSLELQRWGEGSLPNPLKPDSAFISARAGTNAELAGLVKGAGATFVQTNTAPPAGQIRQECIGLVALARHLARVPGRKNLFWYTDGFPLVAWSAEPQIYTDEVSQANHAFSDANVAVYPVDARGLLAADIAPASVAAPPQAATGAGASSNSMGGLGSPALRAPGEAGQDMMTYVAQFTGGQAFLNGNDLTHYRSKRSNRMQPLPTQLAFIRTRRPWIRSAIH